jgi:hypothetical protein
MAEALAPIPSRKEILRARCAVQRLTFAIQAQELRESLNWRRVASSGRARSLVVASVVMLLVGRKHMGKVAGWFSASLALVRLLRGLREFSSHK